MATEVYILREASRFTPRNPAVCNCRQSNRGRTEGSHRTRGRQLYAAASGTGDGTLASPANPLRGLQDEALNE